MRRLLTLWACGVLGAALGPLALRGAGAEESVPGVVDLHVDLPYRVNYKGGQLGQGTGQYPASALHESGVLGVVLPLYVPNDVSPAGPRREDLERSHRRLLELLPKTPPYALPGCRADSGAVRTWLAFEGAAPLAKQPESAADWLRRGVRLFGLVHTHHNALASSSGDTPRSPHGLTDAGRRVAGAIHGAGGVLDVSHASDAATDEMIALAQKAGRPIVATHSNARALASHPRNLTDAQLSGIAKTGGVVGVNFHSRFLVEGGRTPELADVVRHIRHIAKVAGIAHVAIGSDFEGGIRPPKALGSIRGFAQLAKALRESGMSTDDVTAIFHRNALRVLCPAEKSAR